MLKNCVLLFPSSSFLLHFSSSLTIVHRRTSHSGRLIHLCLSCLECFLVRVSNSVYACVCFLWNNICLSSPSARSKKNSKRKSTRQQPNGNPHRSFTLFLPTFFRHGPTLSHPNNQMNEQTKGTRGWSRWRRRSKRWRWNHWRNNTSQFLAVPRYTAGSYFLCVLMLLLSTFSSGFGSLSSTKKKRNRIALELTRSTTNRHTRVLPW